LILLGAMAAACAPAPEPVSLEGANVVLIVIDTLRVDHLGCFGYSKPTSPVLDALCERSVVFENAVSVASQTVPSVLSLWTGVYPREHGNQYYTEQRSFRVPREDVAPRVPEDLPLLAERMRARGYRTGAVVGNPWLKPEYGFARGFESYRYLPGKLAFLHYPRGSRINKIATQLLRRWRNERFFLYLHYMEPHFPYRALPEDRERFAKGLEGRPANDPELRSAVYDASVHTLDRYLAQLLGALETMALTQSTLVVITADHGEELFDHGKFGHGHALYEEQVASLMIFSHPALRARRVSEPVSLVDLLPTLAALLGGDPPEGGAGLSLAPWIVGESAGPPPERSLFSELATQKAVRRGSRKLIRSGDAAASLAFDLADDPGERKPVAEGPAWRAELEAALVEFEAAQGDEAGAAADETVETVDPETRKRLEMLGY
jgi:arylsulfatase A-like enzyme